MWRDCKRESAKKRQRYESALIHSQDEAGSAAAWASVKQGDSKSSHTASIWCPPSHCLQQLGWWRPWLLGTSTSLCHRQEAHFDPASSTNGTDTIKEHVLLFPLTLLYKKDRIKAARGVIVTFYYFCIPKNTGSVPVLFVPVRKNYWDLDVSYLNANAENLKTRSLHLQTLQSGGCLPQVWLCVAFWLVKLIQSTRNRTWVWCK